MSLGLLAPLGLLALGALLLPVLLHLARRAPQRRTEFAALRWLAARLRPRRRLRIEEPWLLLLRLLLVACIALLFARPVWNPRDAGAPWVLVHPAVGADAARSSLADVEGAEWRWLAPGFPPLEEAPPPGMPALSSLLRDADAQLANGTRLAVVVPRVLDGLDAERPRLARSVRWVVLRSVLPTSEPPAAATPPRTISLRGAADAEGRRFLIAAARANGWRIDTANADAPPTATTVAVLWLDARMPDAALLAWVQSGGTLWLPAATQDDARDASIAWRNDAGEAVATRRALGRGQVLQWRHPLRPDALPLLLEPAFARGLADALESPRNLPARADAEAMRPRSGAAGYTPPPRPLDPWLVWLAIALFAAERVLATRPSRRGVA